MVEVAADDLILILIRHAKSSWKEPVSDIKRPLNKRGRRDAPVMAARLRDWLVANGRSQVVMRVSTARRAQATADHFAEALADRVSKRSRQPELYGADAREILTVMQAQKNHCRTQLLFGHNPGFTDAVNVLSRSTLGNLPTCGIAILRAGAGRWQEVAAGTCELLELDYPKRTRAAQS